jgi:hypothetical protein
VEKTEMQNGIAEAEAVPVQKMLIIFIDVPMQKKQRRPEEYNVCTV